VSSTKTVVEMGDEPSNNTPKLLGQKKMKSFKRIRGKKKGGGKNREAQMERRGRGGSTKGGARGKGTKEKKRWVLKPTRSAHKIKGSYQERMWRAL